MKTNLHTHPIPGFTSVNAEDRKNLGIRSGDTIRVSLKIKEKGKGGKGEKIRIQAFEGMVLSTKHGAEPGATFTVRKVSNGVGIERIFPLYSPSIDKIEIVKRSKVRRSKLYYIRDKVQKEIKRTMRKSVISSESTMSDAEYQEQMVTDQAAQAEAAQAQEVVDTPAEMPADMPVEETTEDAPADTPDEAPVSEDTEDMPTEDAAADMPDNKESSEEMSEDMPAAEETTEEVKKEETAEETK